LTKPQLAFLREQLGEAFHTGFRKATDHPSATTIWRLIRDLPDEEYAKVIEFVVWGLGVTQGDED
jgi:hypothetical protein